MSFRELERLLSLCLLFLQEKYFSTISWCVGILYICVLANGARDESDQAVLQRFLERTDARARSLEQPSDSVNLIPGSPVTSNVVTLKVASGRVQGPVNMGSDTGVEQPCNTDFSCSDNVDGHVKPASPLSAPVSVHANAGNVSSNSIPSNSSLTESVHESVPSRVSTPTRDSTPDSSDDLQTPPRNGTDSMET